MTTDLTTAETSVESGTARADRFIVYALALFRGLQLSIGLVVVVARADQFAHLWLVLLAYVVTVAWSLWLFGTARRLGHVTRLHALGDVAVVCLALLAVGLSARGGEAETWGNWVFATGTTTTMLAAATLPFVSWLVAATALAVALTAGAWPGLSSGAASVSNAVGNAGSYYTLGIVGFYIARYLKTTGQQLDAANARTLAGEVQRAADRARYEDRLTHYRGLHDTVLQTLTAIARGGLDHRIDEVRSQCAREADYLRRLVEGEVDQADGDLAAALDRVIAESSAFGLRIHYRADGLPADLPEAAVLALAGATREALSNVQRHSGATEAWVTATGETGGVVLRIVDRGHGFEPASISSGFGLAQSIHARLREAGGVAHVRSFPGDGTLVELVWPASLHTLILGEPSGVSTDDSRCSDR